MDNMMKDLRELCETISRSIAAANEKIRNAGGKLTTTDTEYINHLTHALKSIKTTMAMIEAEEMDDGEYSERYMRGGYGYGRGSYRDGGGSYRGSYNDGGSYARGRNARRDSMGRYSRDDGYSRDGGMVDDLRDLADRAPDEQTRQEMQRLIQKLERQQ